MSREKHWRKLVPQCLKQIVSSGMVLQALDVIFLVKFHEIANSTLKIFKFLKIFPTIIRIKKNMVIFSLSLELGFGLFFKWLLIKSSQTWTFFPEFVADLLFYFSGRQRSQFKQSRKQDVWTSIIEIGWCC